MNELLDPYLTAMTVFVTFILQVLLIQSWIRVANLPPEMLFNMATTNHLKIVYRKIGFSFHGMMGLMLGCLLFDYSVLTFMCAVGILGYSIRTYLILLNLTK